MTNGDSQSAPKHQESDLDYAIANFVRMPPETVFTAAQVADILSEMADDLGATPNGNADLEAAYLAGFNASGEGHNGEYPFGDNNFNPADDSDWCEKRAIDLSQLQR